MQPNPHAQCPLCGHCAHLHELATGYDEDGGVSPLLCCYGCTEVCPAEKSPEIRRAILRELYLLANTAMVERNGI